LKTSFCEEKACRVAIRRQDSADRAKAGKAVANSDEWLFSDGIDGVGKELFKLCAKPTFLINLCFTNSYSGGIPRSGDCNPHSKFALAHLLCAAQSLSNSAQKST